LATSKSAIPDLRYYERPTGKTALRDNNPSAIGDAYETAEKL